MSDLSTQVAAGTVGLVQQDAATRNIMVAREMGGTVVNFTGTAGPRVLTGVSAGAVKAASVDAVNGSQMYALSDSTARSLGGGATVNIDGTITAPSYSVGGKTVDNVGAAVTNLDTRLTQNTADISSLQGSVAALSGQSANAVQYDSEAHDAVTLGGAESPAPVALHNVAAGTAATDAVNVGQLNNAVSELTNIAQNAGGNPMFAADGDRSSEAAAANGRQSTAAGANAIALGNQSTAIGANSAARANNSVALGAGSVTERDNSVSVGSEGNERQITHVAAGTQGTDAVNVDQLNAATVQAQGFADQRIAAVQNQVSDVRRDAYGAAAAAMAVASLPQPSAPGKTMVAAGTSRIGGQQGMALGVSYASRNNRWIGKASVSSSSQGSTGVTFSTGYQW